EVVKPLEHQLALGAVALTLRDELGGGGAVALVVGEALEAPAAAVPQNGRERPHAMLHQLVHGLQDAEHGGCFLTAGDELLALRAEAMLRRVTYRVSVDVGVVDEH